MKASNSSHSRNQSLFPLQEGTRVGNYSIERLAGSGGMGEVYLAQDTKLNRPAALKFLTCCSMPQPKLVARFNDEVQALAKVNHANIITIYGVDEYRDYPYYAMEYFEGSTLSDLMVKAQIDLEESVRICIQVCRGLHAAHRSGIVHRDINPQNILVGLGSVVKILDFGLATFKGANQGSASGAYSGTLMYMSPEQLQNIQVDHRSDIFSAGVVLYQLISGRLPFDGEYEAAVIYAIVNEAPESPAINSSIVSPQLEQIVLKALDKTPEKRFQSAEEMADELEAVLYSNGRSGEATRANSTTKLPSVAILHFKDISPDNDQEYFCDGIAEEIISGLAKVKGIRVSSPASVAQFKRRDLDLSEIGAKLKVDSVLQGSVRRAGDRLRITTQLVDVKEGYCLWSEIFDRDIADIFLVQDEISKAIASHLEIELVGGLENSMLVQRTENPEAYSQYLRGRYYWHRRYEGGLAKSIGYFQEAIELDPLYAPAYAGLADSFNIIAFYNFMSPNEACPKAKASATKALGMDDKLAEARTALGWVDTFYEWNFEQAEREFRLSIEINPNFAITHHYYALFLLAMRRFEDGLVEMRRALELDPLATIIATSYGAAYYFMRDHERSVEEHLKALQFDPNFAIAHAFLAGPYVCMERYDEAIAECKTARKLAGESIYPTAFLAYVYGMSGKKREAQRLLDQLLDRRLKAYISSYHIALIYCGLGEFDKSLDYLELALKERDNWLVWLNIYPVFDTLRDHPRFKGIVRSVGLP